MNIYSQKKSIKRTGWKNQSGFTLIETTVTIFVFGVIMAGTTLMLQGIFMNGRQQMFASNNIDGARRVTAMFENELRNATYGANGAYPLNIVSSTEIIFFSTAPNKNGTVSRIRYTASNGTLYKGITDPTGAVYVLTNEKVTTPLTVLSLGSIPLFNYYEGSYNGLTNPLTQPVNINSVKFIKINIIALTQMSQTSTSTFTVTGGASLRNLKTNLGN